MEIGKQVIRMGDIQPLRYPFTKYADLYPVVMTRLINSIVYQLPDHMGSTSKGRTDKWFYNVHIPQGIPPGKYRAERTFIFHVNVLRTDKFILVSDEFEVTK
jgi:hypothetical protein